MKHALLIVLIGISSIYYLNAQNRSVNIFVPNPSVTITPNQTSICLGSQITMDVSVSEQAGFTYPVDNWVVTLSDGTTSTNVTVTNTAVSPNVPAGTITSGLLTPPLGNPTTYTVTSIRTNYTLGGIPGNCQGLPFNAATAKTDVNVYPIPTAFAVTSPNCDDPVNGVTIKLASSEVGVSYQLRLGGVDNGLAVVGTGNEINWAGKHAGVYTVMASNQSLAACAIGMATSTTVYAIPDALASNDGGTKCPKETVTISGSSSTPGVTYSWTGPGAPAFASLDQNPSITNATSANNGIYTLTVTNNGCSNTAQTTVALKVAPDAIVDIAQNAVVCKGTDMTIPVKLTAGTNSDWYVTFSLNGTAQAEVGKNTTQTISITVPNVNANTQFVITTVRSNGCTTIY